MGLFYIYNSSMEGVEKSSLLRNILIGLNLGLMHPVSLTCVKIVFIKSCHFRSTVTVN